VLRGRHGSIGLKQVYYLFFDCGRCSEGVGTREIWFRTKVQSHKKLHIIKHIYNKIIQKKSESMREFNTVFIIVITYLGLGFFLKKSTMALFCRRQSSPAAFPAREGHYQCVFASSVGTRNGASATLSEAQQRGQ